jgi:hypothetical protein
MSCLEKEFLNDKIVWGWNPFAIQKLFALGMDT